MFDNNIPSFIDAIYFCRYDVKTIYQAVLISLEHLIENTRAQDTGIIAIVDWTHFPARYATSLSPKTLRVFLEGLQVM